MCEEESIFEEVNIDDMESDYYESPHYIEGGEVFIDNNYSNDNSDKCHENDVY